jgi:hypothetical protein
VVGQGVHDVRIHAAEVLDEGRQELDLSTWARQVKGNGVLRQDLRSVAAKVSREEDRLHSSS